MTLINPESAAGKLITEHAGTVGEDGKKTGGSVLWGGDIYAVEAGATEEEIPEDMTKGLTEAIEQTKKLQERRERQAQEKQKAQETPAPAGTIQSSQDWGRGSGTTGTMGNLTTKPTPTKRPEQG